MARNNGRDGIPRIGQFDRSAQTAASSQASELGDRADSGPVDIAAVRRDDEFIEAIRGEGPIATDDADEYQLALLLTSWRAEITAPALPAGPGLNEVADAVDREIAAVGLRNKAPRSSRPSLLRPVAGAAAAIAVAMGGLVVFSYNSAPGDPLWNVKSVVFSQQAESTVAQIDTTTKLEQAEQLIASGDVSGAQALLAGASESTGSIIDQTQRSDLEIWLQRLQEQVQTVVPAVPPLPPVPDWTQFIPELPLPQAPVTPPPSQAAIQPLPVTPDLSVPPVTTVPTAPVLPEVPAPVTTTDTIPTVVNEPSPTTATASGSGADGSSSAQTNTLNGG
ncbi:MAG: anti-sigma-D factor RsdA, partial [Rhodococcus sp. (in: high G+C Gram-positive bacteria)]